MSRLIRQNNCEKFKLVRRDENVEFIGFSRADLEKYGKLCFWQKSGTL
jgi:hypothetical protein